MQNIIQFFFYILIIRAGWICWPRRIVDYRIGHDANKIWIEVSAPRDICIHAWNVFSPLNDALSTFVQQKSSMKLKKTLECS